IIGVDEAGRGPLAGPVVTASCYVQAGVWIEGINDSKQTTEEQRETMYSVLVNHPSVIWAASVVSHTEIDQVNILQATMNGMSRSTAEVVEKLRLKDVHASALIALVDGNRVPKDMCVEAAFVIKGDSIIFSIAAASIIAKVTRDRIMHELDKEYPVYKLAQHKGYPTAQHRALLMLHGASAIHRATFAPVR
ncbi:ribonuclease H-like domain-containing protein, partial [Ochromonadaceae sp. CCMP2298]